MDAQNDGLQPSLNGRANGAPEAKKASVDKSIWPMPVGLEEAAQHVREASERFGRTLGFSGEEGERLALQSRQNIDALKQCGTVLTQAFQTSSKSWLEMIQGQWKRNLDGMTRLMQATSVHELGTIQGALVRENLEYVLKDSRANAERSMRTADEAGKCLAALTSDSADKVA